MRLASYSFRERNKRLAADKKLANCDPSAAEMIDVRAGRLLSRRSHLVEPPRSQGASAMKVGLDFQLSVAALVCSALALFFSLLAAFPGLKVVFAAIRDGVLWFALFLVLGGSAFVVWQQVQRQPPSGLASHAKASAALPDGAAPIPSFGR
jgi:hypothetical protein